MNSRFSIRLCVRKNERIDRFHELNKNADKQNKDVEETFKPDNQDGKGIKSNIDRHNYTLSTIQINDIMTKLGCEKDGFKGTYAENELISLMLPLINKGEKQISWIMNTQPDWNPSNSEIMEIINILSTNFARYLNDK